MLGIASVDKNKKNNCENCLLFLLDIYKQMLELSGINK